MKGWLKLLVLATVPILAVTMVANQGLAADKGSQLIFQSNMAHKNFISVANAHDKQAVTVLTQYYNDEMKLVLWYLRILQADSNLLVDPFDHMIPGTATDADMDGTNVSEVLGDLPAMSTDKKAGINSGHFVIAITAVGANVGIDGTTDTDTLVNLAEERNQAETANILFPAFLVGEKMGQTKHGTDNIDNCGVLSIAAVAARTATDNNLTYTALGAEGVNDCRKADPDATPPITADPTSKNVGDLKRQNAQPVSFNHLTGHFTEAVSSIAAGGSDQSASWGGTPIIRPAVSNTANAGLALDVDADAATNSDYQILNGVDETAANVPSATEEGLDGGRLAEKDAGGTEQLTYHAVTGYTNQGGNAGKITDTDAGCTVATATPGSGCRENRGLNMGALVLPALHGGGAGSSEIMLLLSVADEFGGPGDYTLMAAKTGYAVSLMDGMGDALPDPAAEAGPVFGGVDAPETPAGTHIIVEGIRVMTNADLSKCTGTMITGPWMLSSLTDIVPTASSGAKEFNGLDDEMLDPMMSASPGWIKFKRSALTCKKDYGDGNVATGADDQDPDGVPTSDERTYTAGTLIEEEATEDRAFVTTGQALLKFSTPMSTYAASWSLKSPSSPVN